MGKRLKMISLAAMGVCAFCAVSAVSAQAAVHWNVGGAPLAAGSTEKLNENGTLEEIEIERSGVKVKEKVSVGTVSGLLRISCNGGGGVGATIEGTKKGSGRLHVTECSVQNSKGEETSCQTHSEGAAVGTTTTAPVVSELKENAAHTKAFVIFKPESGELFNTVVIEAKPGKACALSGTYKITGSQSIEVPTNTNKTTLQGTSNAAIAAEAGTSLNFGARPAIIDGKGTATLVSGKTWGVAP